MGFGRALLLGGSVLLTCACSQDATQLMVLVNSDLQVDDELAEVRAAVRPDADGALLWSLTFNLSEVEPAPSGTFTLPLTFGIAPRSENPDLPVVIEVAGHRSGDGQPRVVQRAQTGFIESQILLVPMFLARQCIDVDCDPGLTCDGGQCVPDEIDVAELEPISPNLASGDPTKLNELLPPINTGDAQLRIVGGDEQTGIVGERLEAPLRVELVDGNGAPIPNQPVRWSTLEGGVLNTTVVTDESGIAAALATLGESVTTYRFEARGPGATTAVFSAQARPAAPARIAPASGNNQAGVVDRQLPQPLVAVVHDAFDNVITDATVRWRALNGGAVDISQSVGAPYETTATLGPSAGPQQFEASVGNLSTKFVATAAQAAGLEIFSGDGQWAPVGQPLRAPLVVRVLDNMGQPSPDQAVEFSVAGGTGRVDTESVRTSAAGLATTTAVLGPEPGDVHRFRATSNGRTVDFSARGDLQVCTGGAWCYEQPAEGGAKLRGVWVGADTAWAVGSHGFIRRRVGGQWRTFPSGTYADLHGVWGLDSGVAWAVGAEGTILRWDGNLWRKVNAPTQTTLLGVWARSSTEIWAVGRGGVILRGDGTQWTLVPSGRNASLTAVHGSADGDTWAVGSDRALLREQNGIWTSVATYDDIRVPSSVWATSNDRVWVTGGNIVKLWNGTTWAEERPSTTDVGYEAIYAPSMSDIWVVGGLGIYRSNGTAWSQWAYEGSSPRMFGLHGRSGEVTSVGSDGGIRRWSSMGWVTEGNPAQATITDMWTDGATVAVAVGSDVGSIYRWDGQSWNTERITPAVVRFRTIHGTSPSNIWVGGWDVVMRWDGQAWQGVDFPPQIIISALRVVSPAEVWAVGTREAMNESVVLRWTAADGWTIVRSSTSPWSLIELVDGANVWVGGGGSTIQHWDGSVWRAATIRGTGEVTGIFITSPTETWAAVDDPDRGLYRNRGNGWVRIIDFSPLDAWSSTPSDVWFVDFETIYRWNGAEFDIRTHGLSSPRAIGGLRDRILLSGTAAVTVSRRLAP